jgi:hypothetical protein
MMFRMLLASVIVALLAMSGCDCSPRSNREKPAATAPTKEGQAPSSPAAMTPPAEPVARRDVRAVVGDALLAALGDVTGDGRNEILVASASHLRVVTPGGDELASMPVPGGVQVLEAADLDGDGRAEILAGFGRTREHREAPARASIYRLGAGGMEEERVLAPEGERPEIVAMFPLASTQGSAPALFVAHFTTRYEVASYRATRSSAGWNLSPLATLRMAMSYALGDVDGDGTPDLVVGRVYGDAKDVDGDAFVLRPDNTRVAIPTTRGVRGLAVVDTDGDGTSELFLGDGWHQDYGNVARAQLTHARFDPELAGGGGFRSEVIGQMPGEYTLWQILPADLYGDATPALVVRGSDHVHVLRRSEAGWASRRVASNARHVAVGDLDGRPGDEVLVVSDAAEILVFR